MLDSIPSFIYRNEGILYPLLVAVSILLVTAVEHRHKLQDMAVLLRHQVEYGKIAVELGCWTTFLLLGAWGYDSASDGDPSVLLTVAAALELFAFVLMWLPLRAARGWDFAALGVSPRFCLCLCGAHALRLSCTTQFQAYLPVDATGTWIYQALEAATCASCVGALACWKHAAAPLPREVPWVFVAAAALACGLLARHVYGDLAERPTYDQLYAGSIYLETFAWALQASFVSQLPRARINGNFLIPVTMHAVCRAYFWNLAYPEIAPQKPQRLMELFPDALVGCHFFICLTTAAMCIVCLLKVPGLEEIMRQAPEPRAPAVAAPVSPVSPEAPAALTAPVAFVAPLAPVAPVAPAGPVLGVGLRARHVGMPDPVAVSAGLFPEMRGTVPPGCSHFVPVSATYEGGLLKVEYIPVAA